MIFQANGIHRKARATVLISDKIDFKIKNVKILRDTIMIKDSCTKKT